MIFEPVEMGRQILMIIHKGGVLLGGKIPLFFVGGWVPGFRL